MTFLVKYFASAAFFAFAVIMMDGVLIHPARIIPAILSAVFGLFCLTAHEVWATENVLKYRRFLSWKQVPYEHVVKCAKWWFPWFGYCKLDRSIFPWQRLFFVVLRPAFSGKSTALIEHINSQSTQHGINSHGDEGSSYRAEVRCLLMFLVGLVGTMVWLYASPRAEGMELEGYPKWMDFILSLYHSVISWPWSIGTIAALSFFIWRKRFRSGAWILATVIGSLLGLIFVKMVG